MFTTSIDESTVAAEEKRFLLVPHPDPKASGEAVDMALLESLAGAQVEGEPDIVVELMELYLADAPVKLEAMRRSVAGGDGASLARAAHSLKGSSASLGARRAAALCGELERAGGEQPPRVAAVLLEYLELELARVRHVFEGECLRRA